jgi:hypothetical protein
MAAIVRGLGLWLGGVGTVGIVAFGLRLWIAPK